MILFDFLICLIVSGETNKKTNRPHSVSDWGKYSESLGEAEGTGHYQKNGGPKTHLYL